MSLESSKIEHEKKYIVMYSDRHSSYGLFNDLKYVENVQLVPIFLKKTNNAMAKHIRRIHLSRAISNKVHVPLKYLWYEKPIIELDENQEYVVLIVDIVLYSISISFLRSLSKRRNVRLVLLLLNSMKTDAIKQIKREMDSIEWDDIYTYDGTDAKKYGFRNVVYCYYSKHEIKNIERNYNKSESDTYFIGTIKASRKMDILSLYTVLKNCGLKNEFHLMKTLKERMENLPYEDEIDYFTSDKGLIPYEEVLASVIKTKTIIEIVQKDQTGPTLRYYEAICYNKKLLTNNSNIMSFPLYDPRYMKVYNKLEDIDIDWLRNDITVDYHYRNEFSPRHLIDLLSSI